MEILVGALIAVWTAVCILIAIFLSVLAFGGLICLVAPPPASVSRIEALSVFIFCTLLAGLFYIHFCHLVAKSQETYKVPVTRDILLTVPEKSSVNAQVISGNNTINLQNL